MNVGQVIARFGADISNFMSGIQQMVSASSGLASHMGSVAGSMGSGFLSIGSSIVGAVEGIGRFVFFARSAIDGAMGFGNALFGTNAQMEQARTAFTGLLGSGTAADAMLRRLWSFAASTPFEFPELVQDTQELVGMGFAANDVIPVLTAVGDAAAGVGRGQEGVERITLALGQMQARGKVTGQDMMQLTEAGIPAWKILADSMGLSVAQVQKLSEQGKLGAGSVTALYQGMEKMYGGQMAAQATTFNGLLSTLHDNANMALATFSGPLFAMAKSNLQQLTTMVGSPAFSAFAKSLGQEVASGLSNLIRGVQQAVQWFGQFTPPVNQVRSAFANLGAALAPIVSHFQQTGTASQAANTALSALRTVIVGLAAGISGLVNGLAQVVTHGQQIATAFQSAYNATNGFHNAIVQVQTVLASLGVLLATGATAFLLWQGAVALAGLMSAMSVTSIFALVPALIADGVAAAGSALVFVASLVPAFLATTVAALGTAAAVIAATWPFLLIGAAIALAVVGLILLYTHCAPVRAAVASIVTTAQQLWNTLMSNLAPAFAQVGASLGRLGAAFGEMLAALRPAAPLAMALGAVLGGVLAIALGLVIGALMGIVTGLGYFIAGLTMVVTGIIMVFTGIITFISGFFALIVGICTGNTAMIQQAFATMGAGISQIVSGALTMIEGLFVAVFGTIIGVVVGFVQGVITFFENLYNAIVGGSIIPDLVNGILNWFNNLGSQARSIISSLVSAVVGFFTDLGSRALSAISNAVASIISKFNDMKSQAINAANALKSGVASALSGLGAIASSAGKAVIDGIVGAINNGIGAVKNAVGAIASTVASFLPHSPAEQGPLARLDEFGPSLVNTFAGGIIQSAPMVEAAVNMAVSPIPKIIGNVSTAPVAVSSPGTPSSTTNTTNDLLRQIIARMDKGQRINQYEVIEAIGNALGSQVRMTTGFIR